MNIFTDKDDIIRELTKEELAANAPQAHFGWEGTGSLAFEVLADGYKKGAETIYSRMISNPKDFAVVDSLIYPMVFNWRQFVELFLKSIYFELSRQDEENLKKFLNSTGHDLNFIWKEVKPLLSQGKKHVGTKVSIGALEHYIKELNKFDSSSMAMRYPVDKTLDKMHKHPLHFDFINFQDRMLTLYDQLNQIKYDLSRQFYDISSDEDINEFSNEVAGMLVNLREYLNEVSKDVEKDKQRQGQKMSERIFEGLDYAHHAYLNNTSGDFNILADTLFYAGRTVRNQEISLAQNPAESKKEFISLCLRLMDHEGLKFGTAPREDQLNLFSKSPDAIIMNIQSAMAFLF